MMLVTASSTASVILFWSSFVTRLWRIIRMTNSRTTRRFFVSFAITNRSFSDSLIVLQVSERHDCQVVVLGSPSLVLVQRRHRQFQVLTGFPRCQGLDQ